MTSRSRSVAIGFLALALLLLGILTPIQGHAQVAGATLTGTITDPTGAVIPKAQVSIRNSATGVVTDLEANSDGLYTAPNLIPGPYEVTVSAPGFQTQVMPGITLTVGAQQVLNVKLRVGQATQKVEVTGQAAAVQLANATLSAVVGSTTVVELPLNGRSWTDLANLQPGVAPVETQVAFGDSGRGNRGFGAQLSISGSRPQQNNYRLDGISINDYANGGPGSVLGGNLGVDAIQEFSVLTSNYSAEYGKTSGGVVNAISKSGTNQFHGSAYFFLRDEDFDARRFFDTTRSPFHQDQYGASAGGPIRKDKTFVFADFERIVFAKGVSRLDVVPSVAARNGLLCSVQPADGSCTTQQLPAGPTTNANGVDLNIAKFLGMYPLPNGPAFGNGDVASFVFAGQRLLTENFFTARIDHHFSEKDSLFGTYMFDRTPFTSAEPLGVVLLGAITKRQIFALEETHVFSPALVNTVRLGFNRDFVNNDNPVAALNPLAADHSLAAVPGQYAPGCQCPDGMTLMEGGLGGAAQFYYRWNAYQVYDDAFLTKGLHSLKFGFGFERDQDNQITVSEEEGLFAFGSMQKFLTNQPKRLRAGITGLLTERGMRNSIIGGYLQDDWRARPSLTLNLGMRYEISTVPFEVQGKTSNIYNLTDQQPVCGKLVAGCGSAGPYFFNPTLRNFEPRFGFAWDPLHNGKTAVRGGFGVFDGLPMLYQFVTLNGRAFPFFEIGSASNLPQGSFPSGAFSSLGAGNFELGSVEPHPKRNYVLQWNFNIQQELTPSLTATIGYVAARGIHQPFRVDDANLALPVLTSAGYLYPNPIGSGVNGTGNELNPFAGSIRYLNWAGNSAYNALQLGIAKRMSHGLQIQGSFTWGKSIDNNSGVIAGDNFSQSVSSLNWFNLKLTRGLSDFNVGRTLVINGLWQVPAPKSALGPVGWLANGWQLGGIFKVNDGVPFSALFGTGGDPTGSLSSDDYAYPDRVPGCNPVNTNFRNSPSGFPIYVNSNCFALPTAPNMAFWQANCDTTSGIYGPDGTTEPFPVCFNLRGNSGRNIMIGPGLMNLDFSIFKNNPVKRISETFNVQFRAEFFNILNRANFSVPDLGSGNNDIFDATGAVNPTGGLLTTLTTDPREIQFALKLVW
jgi:Carboxypeptidase regulatory-like domain/TonB-dependent Receptor Plug Domain